MPRANPQQIAQAFSLYLAFTPWKEIAATVGLSEHCLTRRSAKEGWPLKRQELHATAVRPDPDSPTTWVEAVRKDCESALKRLQTYPIPTSIKEEKERVSLLGSLDEIARRAYGIDKAGNALTVNLNYMRDQPKQVQMPEAQKVIDVGTVKSVEA